MALFTCPEPECGNRVSTKAICCPKCGCPVDASVSNLAQGSTAITNTPRQADRPLFQSVVTVQAPPSGQQIKYELTVTREGVMGVAANKNELRIPAEKLVFGEIVPSPRESVAAPTVSLTLLEGTYTFWLISKEAQARLVEALTKLKADG